MTRIFQTTCLWACLLPTAGADLPMVANFADSTAAPHGRGNIYAPDIVRYRGEFLLFFGAQGKDGHDRIHLARSKNGADWKHDGVVFSPEGANHVNDPSVVVVGGELYMFYTLAASGVTDSIGLAKSKDGRVWTDIGAVHTPSEAPAWDSLLVGRPSVIYDGARFHMWFDGRKDLPLEAPDPDAPKSGSSRRFVGYATSPDGVTWSRRREPVFGEDAGGVHVSRIGEKFVMVIESRVGTKWATSADGMRWESRGLLHPKSQNSPYGHVTPFLRREGDAFRLYYGAAMAPAWDHNSIHSAIVNPAEP